MPNEIWAIQDTNTSQWCAHYSTNPNFCTWGSAETAQIFSSKSNADAAIAAWPTEFQDGKIGSNPPHPPK